MARLSHLSSSGLGADGAKRRRYVRMHCARQPTAEVFVERSCVQCVHFCQRIALASSADTSAPEHHQRHLSNPAIEWILHSTARHAAHFVEEQCHSCFALVLQACTAGFSAASDRHQP